MFFARHMQRCHGHATSMARGIAAAVAAAAGVTGVVATCAASDGSISTWQDPDEADVVVIGAGVCGLSTALQLAKAGKRVVLFERETVGSSTQASSVNCAWMEVFNDVTDETVAQLMQTCAQGRTGAVAAAGSGGGGVGTPQALPSLNELLLAGTLGMYKSLSLQHNIEFHHLGCVLVYSTEEEKEWTVKNCKLGKAPADLASAPTTGVTLDAARLRVVEPGLLAPANPCTLLWYSSCCRRCRRSCHGRVLQDIVRLAGGNN